MRIKLTHLFRWESNFLGNGGVSAQRWVRSAQHRSSTSYFIFTVSFFFGLSSLYIVLLCSQFMNLANSVNILRHHTFSTLLLLRLQSSQRPHVFRDVVIPVSFVGPHVAEFLISRHTQIPESCSLFKKALYGCSTTQLTRLLTSACESGNADFVIALIDAGGAVNFKGSNGQSLMPLAIRTRNIDIIKILVASGCRINNSVDWVLHEAAVMNRVDFMEILFKFLGNIDVNSINSDGRTPIHVAALHGHVKVI